MSRRILLNIKVWYSKKDKMYCVYDREVEGCGYGSTLGEALSYYFQNLKDFKASLVKFGGGELGDNAKKILEILEKIELGEIPKPYIPFPLDSTTTTTTSPWIDYYLPTGN